MRNSTLRFWVKIAKIYSVKTSFAKKFFRKNFLPKQTSTLLTSLRNCTSLKFLRLYGYDITWFQTGNERFHECSYTFIKPEIVTKTKFIKKNSWSSSRFYFRTLHFLFCNRLYCIVLKENLRLFLFHSKLKFSKYFCNVWNLVTNWNCVKIRVFHGTLAHFYKTFIDLRNL